MAVIHSPLSTWESDPITERQCNYLLKRKAGSLAELKRLTKGQASALIDQLKDKENPGGNPELITEPQIKLIRVLCDEAGEPLPDGLEKLDKKQASVVITQLKSIKPDSTPKVGEGLYLIDNDVYKVVTTRTERLCSMKLVRLEEPEYVSNGVRTHHFIAAPRVLLRLRPEHAMTREQVQKFAQDTNSCVRCGTQLDPNITNEDGSPRFIGPICETKMGW